MDFFPLRDPNTLRLFYTFQVWVRQLGVTVRDCFSSRCFILLQIVKSVSIQIPGPSKGGGGGVNLIGPRA